jgi:outer membrane immunogenic protein
MGVTFTPNLLLYGTGGLAYGGVRAETSIAQTTYDPQGGAPLPIFGDGSASGSRSGLRAGYTVGAGLEGKFASHWSAKLEYLYYDLGSVTYTTGLIAFNITASNWTGSGNTGISPTSTTRFNGQIVRFGINYMLGH